MADRIERVEHEWFDNDKACGVEIRYAGKGLGFGGITMAFDKATEEVRIDTECMSPTFIGDVFRQLMATDPGHKPERFVPLAGNANVFVPEMATRQAPTDDELRLAQVVLLKVREVAGLKPGDGVSLVEYVRRMRENLEFVEMTLRKRLWLGHGHSVSILYGDDGEMQCSLCAREGNHVWDYRRTPIAELLRHVEKVTWEQIPQETRDQLAQGAIPAKTSPK